MMKIILETPRCYLREMDPILDATNAFELNNDFEVIRYTGDIAFENSAAAEIFLQNYKDYERFKMCRWAVIRRSDEAWLGWCGLKFLPDTNEVDLGYRFHQKFWNHGYATETASICIEYGFNKLSLDRIVGRAEIANIGSIRVLEKCGMTFIKHMSFHGNAGVEYEIFKDTFSNK